MKILKFKLISKLDFFDETMKGLKSRIFRLLHLNLENRIFDLKSLCVTECLAK